MGEERLRVLQMVADGRINVDEAVRALADLKPPQLVEGETAGAAEEEPVHSGPNGAAPAQEWAAVPEPAPVVDEPGPETDVPEVPRPFRHFWMVPLWAGVGAVVLGGLLMYLVYGTGASAWWLVCGWPVFLLGVAVTAVAWWLRDARWFHLRVRQQGRAKVMISVPLPLGLAAAVVRLIRPFVPRFRDSGLDEMILSLQEELKQGQPIHIDVNEGEDGEHVQLFIG